MMKEFEHLEIKLEEIISATDNFSDNRVIGKGGFGTVYVGELSRLSGKTKVAFKRLDSKFGQGGPEFSKEIRMLSRYTHENLISLLGICSQGDEMILVYEYASRGSLDRYLKDVTLTWTQRIKICLDAAKGLKYLHDPKETYQRVIHCDIKSANILLDDNFNAKVSDFGLSKISPANQQNSMLVTYALGTLGYCDPLFMETYCLTKESDVYSFGVVLFEVLCGRLCYEYGNLQYNILVPMWKNSYKEKKLDEIIFQDLKQQLDPSSLKIISEIAYECLQVSRLQRPTMSRIVDKLKSALELQKYHDMTLNLPKEYADIVRVAVDRPIYTSLEELKVFLSKGVLLNKGKTGEHCERIYIERCLSRDYIGYYSLRDPSPYLNSRFPEGRCYMYEFGFKALVRAQFLSPQITYTVNLVFRHNTEQNLPKFMIKYRIDGEKKVLKVHETNKIEDGWFMAELHRCTSEHGTFEIMFKGRQATLLVAGIEFQPLEERVEDDQVLEYQDIIEAASHPLVYRSIEELKVLLSKGIYLNGYKTWFSLSENGDQSEMISIADCLIPDDKYYYIRSHPHSRFPAGLYETRRKGFRVHVKTQFLSPLTTYTVNLVFNHPFSMDKLVYLGFQYKLEGETETSTVYFADLREDGLYWAELYQFTSVGRSVDLIIIFEEIEDRLEVEGIMFQPLEKIENQLLEDEEVCMQTVMDSEIMTVSKDSTEWTTKKDCYSILCQCFRIVNSKERFSVDKNGKKCLKLSARAACYAHRRRFTWESCPDS
ncbi:kinase-like domain, phloem protein 2-like protein, partial [Tanacetum coccineum]